MILISGFHGNCLDSELFSEKLWEAMESTMPMYYCVLCHHQMPMACIDTNSNHGGNKEKK